MMENGKVTAVTDEDFDVEVRGSRGLVIVDFWAEWCGPCRIVSPIVEQLAGEYHDRGVRVAKLDVDDNPKVSSRFSIRSIPSILFFKDGEHVDTVIGAVPKGYLERKILEHLGEEV
ncbi:MAG: thioredoxin [Gemmatimonadetes bacterium]|nr:thioredoxin [Gemmatimonadota bacterium]